MDEDFKKDHISETIVKNHSQLQKFSLIVIVCIVIIVTFISIGMLVAFPKQTTSVPIPSPTIFLTPTPLPQSYIYNFTKQNAVVFAIGGSHYNTTKSRETATNSAEFYSFKDNKWFFASHMTVDRSGAAAAVVNNMIYVFGGKNDEIGYDQELKTVEEFDLTTNTWTLKKDMPTARTYSQAIPILGRIYITGGSNQSGELNTAVDVYDPASDSWSSASNIPITRATYELVCAPLEDKIYCPGIEKNETLVYNPSLNKWYSLSLSKMLDLRAGGWSSNDHSIFSPGFGLGRDNSILEYIPKENSITETKLDPYIHTTYREEGIVTFDTFMLLIGGRFSARPVRDVYLYGFYDFPSWMKITPLNIGRASAATVILRKLPYPTSTFSQ